MESYIAERIEQKIQEESLINKSKENSKNEGSRWISEFRRIGNLIQSYKKQVYVCIPCKRKFLSYNLYETHETSSEHHKQTIRKRNELKVKNHKKYFESRAENKDKYQIELQLDESENEDNLNDIPLPPPE